MKKKLFVTWIINYYLNILLLRSSVRSLRSMPPVSCMQGYQHQQPTQAAPVHPSIQAIHTVLPSPQQPNVFSRPEVITSRRIPTAVIVSKSCFIFDSEVQSINILYCTI